MYRTWLKKLFLFIIGILVCAGIVAYAVDPLFIYRFRDTGTYWIQPDYTSVGLVKNADYDTILLGSSVTQNFRADEFGDRLGCEVLKVNSGGLNVNEAEKYIDLIQKTGKADTCYVCVDLVQFGRKEEEEQKRVKDYLIDDYFWNDYPYLLGYETWMRFIPVDLVLSALDFLHIEFPERIKVKTDVDRSGDWSADYTCSKEIVISNYLTGEFSISAVDVNGLEERMKKRIDNYLDHFEFGKDIEYIFFFPPYSALYWHECIEDGYYDAYMKMKEYFEERVLAQENVQLFDFQYHDYITDLDYYRDATHYGPEVNAFMLEDFAENQSRIYTEEQGMEAIESLHLTVREFQEQNKGWLYQ